MGKALTLRGARRSPCCTAAENGDFKDAVGLKRIAVNGANGIANPRYPHQAKLEEPADREV
jgi:hypothetical protein